MMKQDEMMMNAYKYSLAFDTYGKEVFLIKRNSEVKISLERAVEWVKAGISDLDCRKKDEMLQLLKKWSGE